MPNNSGRWTRRQFSQLLAASAASTFLGQRAHAATPHGFAHIASSAGGGAIHTFSVSGSSWHPIQSLESPKPVHLELHPTLPILYAIHNVPLWDYLPRGAVSAYAIDPKGHLALLNTQPLSLAATNPRHAVIAPDGTTLAVTSPEAGIYNILPLAPDGTLHPPTIIRKQLSLNTAETHHLVFLADSKTLLTADSRHQPIHSFKIAEDSLIPIPLKPGKILALRRDASTLAPPTIAAQIDSPTSLLFRPA